MTLFLVAWRLFSAGSEEGAFVHRSFSIFWPEACFFSAWRSFGIGPMFGLPEVLFMRLHLLLHSGLLLSWLSLFIYFFHSDRHNG
jgi:hypothetical protein